MRHAAEQQRLDPDSPRLPSTTAEASMAAASSRIVPQIVTPRSLTRGSAVRPARRACRRLPRLGRGARLARSVDRLEVQRADTDPRPCSCQHRGEAIPDGEIVAAARLAVDLRDRSHTGHHSNRRSRSASCGHSRARCLWVLRLALDSFASVSACGRARSAAFDPSVAQMILLNMFNISCGLFCTSQ